MNLATYLVEKLDSSLCGELKNVDVDEIYENDICFTYSKVRFTLLDEEDAIAICDIFVDENYRNTGVTSYILDCLQVVAKEKGKNLAAIAIMSEQMARLLHRRGFEPDNEYGALLRLV